MNVVPFTYHTETYTQKQTAGMLPAVPLQLLEVSVTPVQQYLQQFSEAVAAQFEALRSEVKTSAATIVALEEKLAQSNSKVSLMEQLARSHSQNYVSSATFASVLKRLAGYLNEIDPTTIEGEEGPADWLKAVMPASGDAVLSPTMSGSTRSAVGVSGSLNLSPRHAPAPKSPLAGPSAAPSTSTNADIKLRGIIRSEICQWNEDTGIPDAAKRHEKTIAVLTKQVAGLKELLEEKATLSTTSGWFESLRNDLRLLREDFAAGKKKTHMLEGQLAEATDRQVQWLSSSHQHLSTRIGNVFAMFGFAEPTDGVPHFSQSALTSVVDKKTSPTESGAATPRDLHGSVHGAPPLSPPAQTLSSLSAPPALTNVEDCDEDKTTAVVLQSTAFVALRQKILDDLVERLTSSRSATASDVGVEMFAVRNDIKQRPTAQRVVEMIREQVNVPALVARCDAVSKLLDALEKIAVRQEDFIIALRTKADVSALDVLLTKDAFAEYCNGHATSHEALSAQLDLIMQERKDISKIFKDVVAYYHHDVSRRDGAGDPHLQNVDDAAQLGLQSIIGGDPRLLQSSGDAQRRQTPGSRASVRKAQPPVLKPITESRAQSQNIPFPPTGGSRLGTLSTSNRSGAKTSTAHVSPPAVALTANQEAYARFVSDEQLKQFVEALPPIPYERSPRHGE